MSVEGKRCVGCNSENSYCATYIGPRFGELRKILFVGLDHGQGECPTRTERAAEVVNGYRNSTGVAQWNLHYKGCVWVASVILDLPCREQCKDGCAKLEQKSCALLHFAQANAVKCVSPESKEMRFLQARRIPDCLALAFEEAVELQPDLIVLQSASIEDLFYDLLRERGNVSGIDDFTGSVVWNSSGKKSLVLTVRHPAAFRFQKGSFEEVWDRDIVPKLAVVQNLLADHSV